MIHYPAGLILKFIWRKVIALFFYSISKLHLVGMGEGWGGEALPPPNNY